ncbi:MAG: hypothetical protein IH958_04495 [Chloroflexi bacterium]|nr:hypothetical protein [Chloroflexota bacterium]
MDSTLNFPANGRLLYMPGIGIALTLVVAIVWLSEVLHPPIVRQVTKAAPVLVLVILVPMFLLTIQNARSPIDAGNVNERFVEQLREAIPSMDAGAILYVVDAPGNLRLFGSTSRLESLVALYYDDVDVLAISSNEIPSTEANLREGDEIFRFVR